MRQEILTTTHVVQSSIQIHVASVVFVPRESYQCVCREVRLGHVVIQLMCPSVYTRTGSNASSATTDRI